MYAIPSDMRIYGIEVLELCHFSERCAPEVQAELESITREIVLGLSG